MNTRIITRMNHRESDETVGDIDVITIEIENIQTGTRLFTKELKIANGQIIE